MYASFNGHTATVELLLTHGADINAMDYEGWTALDRTENEQIRQLLCRHGAKYGELKEII